MSGGDGTWKRVSRRLVHRTPFFSVHEDEVITPTGGRGRYGVVDCGECVGVLPFVRDDAVMMVRQHRYLAGRFTWEMPTGGVGEGEAVEEAAQRELAEEAGLRAGRLQHLHSFHTSKSSIAEVAHLFVGRALEPATAEPDDDEQFERRVLPFEQALSMVLDGEITDSMTVIAVLIAAWQGREPAPSPRRTGA